jgi:hypothetical protein
MMSMIPMCSDNLSSRASFGSSIGQETDNDNSERLKLGSMPLFGLWSRRGFGGSGNMKFKRAIG